MNPGMISLLPGPSERKQEDYLVRYLILRVKLTPNCILTDVGVQDDSNDCGQWL